MAFDDMDGMDGEADDMMNDPEVMRYMNSHGNKGGQGSKGSDGPNTGILFWLPVFAVGCFLLLFYLPRVMGLKKNGNGYYSFGKKKNKGAGGAEDPLIARYRAALTKVIDQNKALTKELRELKGEEVEEDDFLASIEGEDAKGGASAKEGANVKAKRSPSPAPPQSKAGRAPTRKSTQPLPLLRTLAHSHSCVNNLLTPLPRVCHSCPSQEVKRGTIS